jgi:CHASE3 domain sensor protein
VTLLSVEEFEVDDQQREAALAHLRAEHARGAFDQAELERRTTEVQQASTVAQLLAATADPSIARLSPPSAVAHQSRVALLAGILVAVVLGLVVLSRLV